MSCYGIAFGSYTQLLGVYNFSVLQTHCFQLKSPTSQHCLKAEVFLCSLHSESERSAEGTLRAGAQLPERTMTQAGPGCGTSLLLPFPFVYSHIYVYTQHPRGTHHTCHMCGKGGWGQSFEMFTNNAINLVCKIFKSRHTHAISNWLC